MESEKLKKYKNRLLVSDLIKEVLAGKLSVQNALVQFPQDKNDINIKCAFDALMHREADEEIRQTQQDYATVQDEFLFDLAQSLKQNENLAQNIIAKYLEFHESDIIPDKQETFKDAIKILKRMINF